MAGKKGQLSDVLNYLKPTHSDGNASFFVANQENFSDIKDVGLLRTYYYGIFFFKEGSADFIVGSDEYQVAKNSIVTIGPGFPFRWRNKKDLIYDAIFFHNDIFQYSVNNSFFYSLDYFCPDVINVIHVNDTEYDEIGLLLNAIKHFKCSTDIIPGLLNAILMLIRKLFWKHNYNNKKILTPRETIVVNFRSLLSINLTAHKNVAFYAEKLNISPKYLSEIMQAETGKSAKKWIEYHLAVEAKAMLSYTKTGIKEITYKLGFEDTSYFTKAFKKWEGVTPVEFRNQDNAPVYSNSKNYQD